MQALFTPWRYSYITAPSSGSSACFFCAAAEAPDEPERLVVATTPHHVVLLNRHPYSNGHLLLAPRAHVDAPEAASAEAQAELWPLVLRAKAVLARLYRPDGFNVGANLGRCAGAGVPQHFHLHVVPRWQGDTSFMSVIGDTRLVPEDLDETRERLRPLFESER